MTFDVAEMRDYVLEVFDDYFDSAVIDWEAAVEIGLTYLVQNWADTGKFVDSFVGSAD